MVEQSGELLKKGEVELIERLQTELEFKPDETGEWLINDEFTTACGLDGNEFLPARTRVSLDGTRLEVGAYKEDLVKNLELARIAGQNAQDLDFIRNFWPESGRITMVEEDEMIFFGASIEPTVDDFEKQFSGIHDGLDMPMEGAARGITYEEGKQENNLLNISIKQAETPSTSTRSVIFSEQIEEDDDPEEGGSCRNYWDRSAENLRTFSIETWETFVGDAATELRIGDEVFIGTGIGHLDAHNAKDTVRISDNAYTSESEPGANDRVGARWDISFSIPEGSTVKTVDDIADFSKATLNIKMSDEEDSKFEVKLELDVTVTVEDHKVSIESRDGVYGITFFEPACMNCETPIWKFKWPDDEEEAASKFNGASASMGFGGGVIMDAGRSSGNGVYSYHVGKYEYGKRKTMYCHDCFCDEEEAFANQYPLARRDNALAAVRAKLDESGYADVQLEPTQVWPSWYNPDYDIDIFAFIKYNRNGREILRKVGFPALKYDGEIDLDMPSREYVEFR